MDKLPEILETYHKYDRTKRVTEVGDYVMMALCSTVLVSQLTSNNPNLLYIVFSNAGIMGANIQLFAHRMMARDVESSYYDVWQNEVYGDSDRMNYCTEGSVSPDTQHVVVA